MARQVFAPQPPKQKSDDFGRALKLAGLAAGAYFGGVGAAVPAAEVAGMTASAAPAGFSAGGALSGAMTGAGAAGLTEDLLSNQRQPIQAQTLEGGGAMSRRMQSLRGDDLSQIRNSIDSLKYLPQEQREQYAEPLVTAEMFAMKKRGMNYG